MKIATRILLFSFALIIPMAGVSNADIIDFKIGKPGVEKWKTLFFSSPHTSWLEQNTLKLSGEIFQQPTRVDQDLLFVEKKSIISIYLGGGLNNIDGGDMNQNIRSANTRYEDLNRIAIAISCIGKK